VCLGRCDIHDTDSDAVLCSVTDCDTAESYFVGGKAMRILGDRGGFEPSLASRTISTKPMTNYCLHLKCTHSSSSTELLLAVKMRCNLQI